MNKAELVAAVAEKAGLSKKDSEKAVNAAFSPPAARSSSLVLAPSRPRRATPALAATPEPRKRSRSLPAVFPLSRPARLSRTPSRSNLLLILNSDKKLETPFKLFIAAAAA